MIKYTYQTNKDGDVETCYLYDTECSPKPIVELSLQIIDDTSLSAIHIPKTSIKNPKILYLGQFICEPKFRGNGYGEMLIKHVLKVYIPRFYRKFDMIVLLAQAFDTTDNVTNTQKLVKFYSKLGFKKFKNGDVFGEAWMWKKI